MSGLATRGAQHSLTLSFVDTELEKQYQLAAGRESLNGFRTIALASGVAWAVAALLLPTSTNLEPAFAIAVPVAMSATGFGVALLAPWAQTLDRQHALVTVLTSANGIVILALALISGLLPGYGVAATMLLFAWGFVSRTRFIYAALRTTVIAVGFIVAVELYTGPVQHGARRASSSRPAPSARCSRCAFSREIGDACTSRIWSFTSRPQQLQEESAKSERLILNILPASIAERLRNGEQSIADEYPLVSVLFADIVGFTPLAARLEPRELVEMLSGLFSAFDDLVADRGLEKIKTIGDSYMAVGGLTGDAREQAVNTVSLGLAMIEEANKRPFLGSTAAVPHRRPLRADRRWRHRDAQAGLRPVGRHRQCRQPARGTEQARPRPGERGNLDAGPRRVPMRGAVRQHAARTLDDADLLDHWSGGLDSGDVAVSRGSNTMNTNRSIARISGPW